MSATASPAREASAGHSRGRQSQAYPLLVRRVGAAAGGTVGAVCPHGEAAVPAMPPPSRICCLADEGFLRQARPRP